MSRNLRRPQSSSRAPSVARPRRSLSGLWLIGVCLVVALVLYGSCLGHPFFSDDKVVIGSNATLERTDPVTPIRLLGMNYWQQIDPSGRMIQASADRNLYRPITMISCWLSARLTGLAPWSLRLGNVLLLGLAAAAVGLLAAGWFGAGAGPVAAAAVLLHPVGSDVINRVVGRADILVLLGLTLFLLIDRRAAANRAAAGPGWSLVTIGLAFLAAAVALGAKESGLALLPLAVTAALLDPARDRKERQTWVGPLVALVATLAFLAARAAFIGSVDYSRHHGDDLMENPLQWFSPGQRLSPGVALAGYYLRMLVWPWPMLVFDRPVSMPAGLSPPVLLGGVEVAAAIVTSAWLARRHGSTSRALALAVAWWLFSYGIVSQIPVAIGAYRETRFVVPFLGSFALLTAAAWTAADRPGPRKAIRGLLAALGLAFVVMIVVRNGEYTGEEQALAADLKRKPDIAITHAALGGLHQLAGRTLDALTEFEAAARLAPGSAQAHRDLGSLYVSVGDSVRALPHLREALRLNPEDPLVLMNFGVLRLRQQRLAEAADLLRRSEQLDPDLLHTQLNLAVVEVFQGDLAAATRRADTLEERHPGDPRVASLRGLIDQARRGGAAGQR